MKRFFASSLAGATLLATAPASADVFYKVDFENGDTEAVVGDSSPELIDGTVDAVANPDPDAANSSSMVGRFRVPLSGSTARAELSSQRLPTDGETYRYRWSYYIPNDFFDGADFNWFVNSQWKTYPCEVCNSTYDPDICGGCGGIFDEIRVPDEQSWEFRWRAEPDCNEHSETIALGQWVPFEMLVYWTTGFDGYVRLWRDHNLVKSLDNIRTLFTSFQSGTCDMYWSVGTYVRGTGSKSQVEMFIDDIEISDETGAPDGGVDDAGTPSDAGSNDSSTIDSSGTDAQCISAYGDVEDFVLCEATADSCTFNAAMGTSMSCRDVCEVYGGQCIAAHGNSTGAPCTVSDDISCDESAHGDDICVCSLPNATEPPDGGNGHAGSAGSGGVVDSGGDGGSGGDTGSGGDAGNASSAADQDSASDDGCGCVLAGLGRRGSVGATSSLLLLGWLALRRRAARGRKPPQKKGKNSSSASPLTVDEGSGADIVVPNEDGSGWFGCRLREPNRGDIVANGVLIDESAPPRSIIANVAKPGDSIRLLETIAHSVPALFGSAS